jgi:hypothetical protein
MYSSLQLPLAFIHQPYQFVTSKDYDILSWSHSGIENEGKKTVVIYEWIKLGRKWTGAWKGECS